MINDEELIYKKLKRIEMLKSDTNEMFVTDNFDILALNYISAIRELNEFYQLCKSELLERFND